MVKMLLYNVRRGRDEGMGVEGVAGSPCVLECAKACFWGGTLGPQAMGWVGATHLKARERDTVGEKRKDKSNNYNPIITN